MIPQPFEVWLADVPFDDGYNHKNRPVIVVENNSEWFSVLPMTSRYPKYDSEFQLYDWQCAGLNYQGTVKNERVMLSYNSFIHKIGNLTQSDIDRVERHLHPFAKAGCYIATAIYGSYDCPPVWVLRRYRDYSLSKTWHGRGFIKVYYAVSPTIVKWFGKTRWFNRFWKKKLDKFVGRLKERGYNDAPFNHLAG